MNPLNLILNFLFNICTTKEIIISLITFSCLDSIYRTKSLVHVYAIKEKKKDLINFEFSNFAL